MISRTIQAIRKRSMLLAAGLCFLIHAFGLFADPANRRPLHGDGHGYYAWLPALLIQRDPSFHATVDGFYPGRPEQLGLTRVPETNRYASKYTLGVALLQTPFFLLAHAWTWFMRAPEPWDWWKYQYPTDGYSLFYIHAAGLAGLAYGLAGLAILRRLLRARFGDAAATATLAVLLLGTSLLHYIAAENTMSHAYSFFLFGCFLHRAFAWDRSPTWRLALQLGILGGLIGLVRLPNLILLGILPLLRPAEFRTRLPQIAAIGLLAVACFLPQVLAWRYATGVWFSSGYNAHGEGFNWLRPKVLPVLFSIKKGLFFYAPCLLAAVAGFRSLRRSDAPLATALASMLGLATYVISAWWMWWYGGSFGHRAFVEWLVLLAFPLAAWISQPTARPARTAFLVLACLWTLWWMKLFHTREIHIEGLDRHALYDVFYVRYHALRSFLLP
jgi:hypothetical protein